MLKLENLHLKIGQFSLDNINLTIPSGKYGILLGKTGSGKTTILESICGLRPIKSGKIFINDQDITHQRPAERGIGFVPQDGALFVTKTVYENISFSLKLRKWSKSEIKNRVSEMAELLQINHLLERSVQHLSGGEKQRVSLARALAFFPGILCLDEPLSALDSETHSDICQLLKDMQIATKSTVIHITHNPMEATFLSDITYEIQSNGIVQVENNQNQKVNL